MIGPHEIFHIFVVLAALSHWFFIYTWCDHPLGNVITFQVHVFPEGRVVARALGESLEIAAESVEALRKIVVVRVAERFHASIRPEIRLCYIQVEHL